MTPPSHCESQFGTSLFWDFLFTPISLTAALEANQLFQISQEEILSYCDPTLQINGSDNKAGTR